MKKEIIFMVLLLVIGSIWLLSCHKDRGDPTQKDPKATKISPISFTL
jgi:hypothetical protein